MAKNKAPAVIIPVRQQSAPKEHPADRAIMQAAEEIDSDRWTPPASVTDELAAMPNVALRNGPADLLEQKPTRADFAHTENTLILAEHPRVQEAMRRLEQERDEAPNSQEYFEKAAMLHELNAQMRAGQKWEGQQRWQGEENEAMRRGTVLSPLQFYAQLMKVLNPAAQFAHHTFAVNGRPIRMIGVPPLLLGREAVLQYPGVPASQQSGRVPLFVLATEKPIILMPGQPEKTEEPMLVGTLQWPASTEWMIMNFDQFGVPTTAKFIGWRTVILSMIRCGVITEKQANKAFPLSSGPASSWYRQQMFEWRNAHRGRA